ncbi:hypothetical protein L9F63_012360, partial [Diploptera punctata]
DLADAYYLYEGRRVYVTSASFLELIYTFNSMFEKKSTGLLTDIDEYGSGYYKLEEAASI